MTAVALPLPCPGRDRPLWTSAFRVYFTARAISLLGDAMLPVALTVGLIEAGHGAAGIGYAFAAWMAPMALLVLFGGVLADKFSARRMMIGADAARLLTQLALAAVFAAGARELWQILALLAVSGAATAMFQPGVASMVPQVATDIQRANATLRVAEAITTLLGPAIAGVLIVIAGAGGVLAIDAMTYAISGACLLVLKISAAPAAKSEPVWRSLAEGWTEFRSRPWLWGVISVWAVYGLAVFGPALPLGASILITQSGSTAYAIVTAAFGAGTIIGGLAGLRLRPPRPLAAGATAMLLFAFYPLSLVVELPVWTVAIGQLLAGAGFAFWGVMWATAVQTQVPAQVLNRVYAYDVAGSIMSIPIGRALAGPMGAAAGERQVLAVSGVIAVVSCVVLLAIPAVRRLAAVPAQQ